MTKPTTPKPAILHTREAMEAVAAEYVRQKLAHLALTAALEQEKAAIEKRCAPRLNKLALDIELNFAAVQNFCTQHRALVLDGKAKSFETLNATIGFRDTPPRVDKVRSKETWGAIARRLLGLVFTRPEDDHLDPLNRRPLLDCGIYVREGEPEVAKDVLLADRAHLTADQLTTMGLRFESEELFYIEPKSQVAQGDTKAA
jgi:phage host-nuclease inhibitor protein Gam